MQADELLKTWPDMANRSAASILELPAWRLTLDLEGEPATLALRADDAADEVLLSVLLDDAPVTLGISDSPLYPDLHLVWGLRASLPDAVLLALVEKECGLVFQAVEKATRRLLTVKGLAEPAAGGERRRNYLLSASGNSIPLSLTQLPFIDVAFGQLCNVDCSHDSVRAMVRTAYARYAAYPESAIDVAALAPGDLLVLPEDAAPDWQLDGADAEGEFAVRSGTAQEITFAQLADDALPPVPEPGGLVLSLRGRIVAEGSCVRCGDACAFRVEVVNR